MSVFLNSPVNSFLILFILLVSQLILLIPFSNHSHCIFLSLLYLFSMLCYRLFQSLLLFLFHHLSSFSLFFHFLLLSYDIFLRFYLHLFCMLLELVLFLLLCLLSFLFSRLCYFFQHFLFRLVLYSLLFHISVTLAPHCLVL